MSALRVVDTLAADLDTSVRELVASVVGWAGLSPEREADLRHTAHAVLLDVVHANDALVAATVELEAIDRRLDEHVRGCLRRCRWWMRRRCPAYEALQRRRDRQQQRVDRAYRSLVARGGWR